MVRCHLSRGGTTGYDSEASPDTKLTYAVYQWAKARRRDP